MMNMMMMLYDDGYDDECDYDCDDNNDNAASHPTIIVCVLYAHFTNSAELFNQNLCLRNIAIIVQYIA